MVAQENDEMVVEVQPTKTRKTTLNFAVRTSESKDGKVSKSLLVQIGDRGVNARGALVTAPALTAKVAAALGQTSVAQTVEGFLDTAKAAYNKGALSKNMSVLKEREGKRKSTVGSFTSVEV